MRYLIPALTVTALAAGPASAAELKVAFETPRLKAAEYHRPYVAIWLENSERTRVADLALFYKQRGGDAWLKDLRTWWRKGGRETRVPADGLTGATRAPGLQAVNVPAARLAKLPAGQYTLVIEAAREAGGRESVSLPIELPLRAGPARQARGTDELGAVAVTVTP